jgi:hypothetical protein
VAELTKLLDRVLPEIITALAAAAILAILARLWRGKPKPQLYVEWSYVARERETLANGSKLERSITPKSEVLLALKNAGKGTATEVVVTLTGNADTFAEPTSFFQGESGWVFSRKVVWKSAPGIHLDGIHKKLGSQAIDVTKLDLGTVYWDRDDGLYWLEVTVVANGVGVKFELSLKPQHWQG